MTARFFNEQNQEVQEYKIPLRKTPAHIQNFDHSFITVKEHPEIFTEGRMLLFDRTEEEIKLWQDIIKKKKNYSGREISLDYKVILTTYDKNTKYDEILLAASTGLAPLPEPIAYVVDKYLGILAVFQPDSTNNNYIFLGAEAYAWLTKEGYILYGLLPDKGIRLSRNKNEDAGVIMGVSVCQEYLEEIRGMLELNEQEEKLCNIANTAVQKSSGGE
jgi:hypothetical protein